MKTQNDLSSVTPSDLSSSLKGFPVLPSLGLAAGSRPVRWCDDLPSLLQSTHFGDISRAQAEQALFAGLTDDETRTSSKLLIELKAAQHFTWSGWVPNKIGLYWAPNPFDVKRVLEAPEELKVQKDGQIKPRGWWSVLHYHGGLGAKSTSRLIAGFCEIDRGTIAEQLAKIGQLTDDSGFAPNLIIMSGDDRPESIKKAGVAPEDVRPGKSVHAYWTIQTLNPDNKKELALWDEIQKHLIALLGSDPAIGDTSRLMRAPSSIGRGGPNIDDGPCRIQTTLRAVREIVNPVAFLAALERVAATRKVDVEEAARPPKKATTGLVSSHSGSARGDDFDANSLKVVMANGGESTVAALVEGLDEGDKVAIHCPDHQDRTPSAVIFVGRNGRPSIWCSTCCRTRWASTPKIAVPPPEDTQKQGVIRLSSRYLPALPIAPDARIVYVRSPRDTGKTTQVVNFIAGLVQRKPEARILIPVPRQSLVSNYIGRLRHFGFVDYREIEGKIGAGRVVICLDSLARLDLLGFKNDSGAPFIKPWDLVFLDESEQAISHIDGATVRKNTTPEVVVNTLRLVCRSAKLIMFADADFSSLTGKFARRMAGLYTNQPEHHPGEYLIRNSIATGRSAEFYGTREALDLQRKEWWKSGEKLAIFSTTRAEAKRIATDLETERPDAIVIMITSETSADYRDLLVDPDAWIAKNQPDCIVYSPSMGTGVDVAIQGYFSRVMAYCHVGHWTTVWDCLQGLERVRHPIDQTRAVWCDSRQIWGQTNRTIIEREMKRQASADIKKSFALCPFGDDTIIRLPIDHDCMETLIDVRIHRAEGQGKISSDMVSEMRRLGWSLSQADADDPEIEAAERKRIWAMKKAQREAEIAAIVAAPLMDLEKANEILRQGIRVTPAELASARKSALADFTGFASDQIDAQTVKNWLSGDLRRRTENGMMVSSFLARRDKTVEAFSSRQMTRWLTSSSQKPLIHQNIILGSMLLIYNGNHKIQNPNIYKRSNLAVTSTDTPSDTSNDTPEFVIPTDPEKLRKLQAKVADAKKLKAISSGHGGARGKDDPFEPLRETLKAIGLEPVRRREQKKVNGKVEWTVTGYDVTPESRERMHKLVRRYELRIRDRWGTGPDDFDTAMKEYFSEAGIPDPLD